MTTTKNTEHDGMAASLVALKEDFYRALSESGKAAREDRLTTRETQAVIDLGDAVTAACEEFRRAHYPKAHRVACALGEVFTVSPAGRSVRKVYGHG